MKSLAGLILCLMVTICLQAQKTENVIIVTLDGMRWQEVFSGADKQLLKDIRFTKDTVETFKDFWDDNVSERRKILFPFLWNIVARQGQLYGNRYFSNKLDNANPYKFSYPGYNELLTGYPDVHVSSNEKVINPNENILEFISKQEGYQNKVAAFATWDVFPYILNKPESHFYINAGMDNDGFDNSNLSLIKEMQSLSAKPLDVRLDVFTYFAAREYMKANHPKMMFIGFDETDDFAHSGQYDQYLKSAHAIDAMIADLWNYIQSIPQYTNKTTLIITCDHGRGDVVKENWKDHGEEIQESGQIWLAAIGPDIKPIGEIKTPMQLYQKQIASTITSLLGFQFTTNHIVAEPIASLLPTPTEMSLITVADK